MEDVNFNPGEEHESRPEQPTGENIPLALVGVEKRQSWEPERLQEKSFRGESHEREVSKEELVKKLYQI